MLCRDELKHVEPTAVIIEEKKYFFVDKKCERGNLNVLTLKRPAVPL